MSILNNLFSGSRNSGSVLGIDIGSSSLKVVELKESGGVVALSTYGEMQLGPYSDKEIGETVELDTKQEQQALVDIMREATVESKRAVFAMPLSTSFVTNVSIQHTADTDLDALVRVEARKVIPASLNDVTLDWAEVGPDTKKGDKKDAVLTRDILIAAIQNSALNRFKVLMQFVGLSNHLTEIECFSALRGLGGVEDDAVTAILDLGATSSKMYIMRRGLLVRMYRIQVGGNLVTKKIVGSLGTSYAQSEEIKCLVTPNHPQYESLLKLNNETYNRALREFFHVLSDFERKTEEVVAKVFLTGGASLFYGLDSVVKEVLNKDVSYAKPFSKVSHPAFMGETLESIGPSFTVALGAAIRMYE